MNNYHKADTEVIFDCGCVFPISNGRVQFCADLHRKNSIKFNCPYTYEILGQGLTQGVFQLQSPLGTQWTKKVLPLTLEHLSALGSILRPGCLESKSGDGTTITMRYERKKNGKMELTKYHPIVDDILKDTYGENIYQEESIELAKQCAGFTLQEGDSLRKAAGKKLPEEMTKMKNLFLCKGKELGIFSEQQLEEIFNWIEASQRYSFNHSHAFSYGLISYVTAYIKAHFPLQFYKSWLRCEDKREEYAKLINEAKLFNINTYVPDIREYRTDFYVKGGNIYFGLHNIKGLVKKDLDSLAKTFAEKEWSFADIGNKISWIEFLRSGLEYVSSKTAEGLIHSGSLDCFGIDRAALAYDYERWNRLTPKEKDTPFTACKNVLECVRTLIICMETDYEYDQIKYKEELLRRENSGRSYKTVPKEPKENRRLEKIREIHHELASPLYNIIDTCDSVIFAEENLLGVALTRHKTDEIALATETSSCLEIANGRKGYVVLRVKIERVSTYKCKNGQSAGRNMMFLDISDKSSVISAVAFPDVVEENQHLLTRGNLVFLSGSKDKDSFIIKRVYSSS